MRMGAWRARLAAIAVMTMLAPTAARAASGQDCEVEFNSTFDLIQAAIFENKGCTNTICHGAAAAGGLDLRAGRAFENLVDADGVSVPGSKRVVPGQTDESLLFLNLAAKTWPTQFRAPLRAMPLDPLPALSENETKAVREWIQLGASRTGVVAGTGALLNACLPPPKPIEVEPLPPPAPGVGVQLHLPRWFLDANSEREVCIATYFDFSDAVPAEMRDPTGTKMRINASQIRQDAISHHLFAGLYDGQAGPDDPVWGGFSCKGGPYDAQPCDPTDPNGCGTGGGCSTDPRPAIGCIGFGPPDAQFGFNTFGITGTQETAVQHTLADGVYAELPIKGMALWSSHAFNLTDTTGKLEAWINLLYAPAAQQRYPEVNLFDARQIFKMVVPPFQRQEVCAGFVLPPHARLIELTSHMHRRGKRFRDFLGAFRCDGGPHSGDYCSPLPPDGPDTDICAGAPCRSARRIMVGDCNFDGDVMVDELVTSVSVALGETDVGECVRIDGNGDRLATVDELVRAVTAALTDVAEDVVRDPEATLIYASFEYTDPMVVKWDPPLQFPGPGSLPDERTITYCALYDNGYADPTEVKTNSGSPLPPGGIGLGGPCVTPIACTAGSIGAACSGRTSAERNAMCDSAPGAGDGVCDACTLRGGVTTEDEMFILLGSYYVP
jgi:hypothetical protein